MIKNFKNIIMDTIPESDDTFKTMIAKCNTINSSNEGRENDTENVDFDKIIWKYYKIELKDDKKFTVLEKPLDFYLIKTTLNDGGRPLFVIPGYSDKSICWTIGEMNRYIVTMPECFKEYSDIYLINLENVKDIQKGADKSERNQLDADVTECVNMIINRLDLKNISLLGRSAGGGVCILLATMNMNVVGLNLACPGGRKDSIDDFIRNRSSNPIPIHICHTFEDTTIKIEDSYQIRDKLREDYIKQGKNLLKFIEISTGYTEPGINHRVQEELIRILV